jgi:hypothetical protein
MQVVVADLADGAPAAGLLGGGEPGVRPVSVHGTRLIVAIPELEDAAPVGPRSRTAMQTQRSPFTEAVTAACSSSDVLLTLAPLDPSLGGDHLATWAAEAVVVITAGRSSWTKIHAVGEMVRLAGTRLASAVLVGADNTDDSLGVVSTSKAGHDGQAVNGSSNPDLGDSFINVDRSIGGGGSDYR